ncbi:hypothetical protein AMJ57_01735 [Parcubacteria bacterium SG8_24]|nr:MAG: hypothetical protein AMJ57_01735 [Parcubacteria bacterium SG8_24]
MPRNENISEEERDELKKEIKQELRHEAARRKLISCGACLVAELVLLSIPVIFVLVVLAKTGLMTVPLLTGWLYEPVAPTRIVAPLAGSTMQDVLESLPFRADVDLQTGIVELKLTEQELTTILRDTFDMLQEQESFPLEVHSPQMAVTEQWFEMFAVAPRDDREIPLRLRFVPEVQDGQFEFAPQEMSLGGLTVGEGLSGMMFTFFGGALEDRLNEMFSGIGRLEEMRLEEGRIGIILRSGG